MLTTDNDLWTGATGENEGSPFILRFRQNLNGFIATQKYNSRLTITWSYDSEDETLLPSDNEMELMGAVEDRLVVVLESDVHSVLAFVYTGQSQREWHWYSTNVEEAVNRLNSALADFDALPIELSVEDDPEWSEYNAVLEGSEDTEEDDEEYNEEE